MSISNYWKQQPWNGQWMSAPIVERFWSRVTKGSDEECWPWNGYASKGYGVIWEGKRAYKAHRLSWELANNRTCSPTEVVRHLCGNSICVNPRHLDPGSQSQNAQDMVKHGRAHLARVTPDVVLQLRARYQHGEKVTHLAHEIGFTRQGMRALLTGKTWKFVKPTDAEGNML